MKLSSSLLPARHRSRKTWISKTVELPCPLQARWWTPLTSRDGLLGITRKARTCWMRLWVMRRVCAHCSWSACRQRSQVSSLENKFTVVSRTLSCVILFLVSFSGTCDSGRLRGLSAPRVAVGVIHDGMVTFGCRHVKILNFREPKNAFLDFTNFPI